MDNLRRFTTLATFALLFPVTANAQTGEGATGRRPLDHHVYDIWNSISDEGLSNDGAWALYDIESEQNDPVLHIASLSGSEGYAVERGEAGVFTDDARFVVFRLKPSKAAVEKAKQEETRPDPMPKDSLGILDLASGEVVRVAKLDSFKLPEKAGGWLAYKLAEEPDSAGAGSAETQEPAPGTESQQAGDEEEEELGSTLVLRNLETGVERRIANVTLYRFSDDGARLVYATSTEDGSGDGVFAVETASGETRTLMTGAGEYKGIALDSVGVQVAFLANTDDHEADPPEFTLYHWHADARDTARAVATSGDAPRGWWISEHGELTFSRNGQRLFFGTAPRPEPEPDSTVAEDEKVVVDVWAWTDPYLQPMQLERLEEERRRSYRAVVHLDDGRIVQLATEEVPEIMLADQGDADFVLGRSDLPYRKELSWGERGADYYVIDVRTGARERVVTNARNDLDLSPNGTYATWFSGEQRQWLVLDLESRETRVLSQGVPHPVHDELADRPADPGPYGAAGWSEDDAEFLIYDRHDIWALDPTGESPPRNVTDGVGRRDSVRFRTIDLDPDDPAIDADRDILLSAFHLWTKQEGVYRDRLNGDAEPVSLLALTDRSFGSPRKARDADAVMLTRSSFEEFPDLYVTDTSFSDMTRISDANPQQAQYRWGTAELVDWRSSEGTPLQGILYKPEDFDPSRRYPMLVYFYERLSDRLHRHIAPAADRASINITFYVSRGYLVFTPDIPYQIGYPGESAVEAVVPGVLSLIDLGFVDPQRIGVQGHSWGGYQIAYMLTETDLFTAAEAGAPVSNMISAYGGIRWGSGMSRMFQYEKAQSRIGGSLWEKPMHFIENSPIFRADKVQTPLLMMHNDADGAVPWEQGIEYFVALRRLDKPVWMLNYNGEEHGLQKEQNRKDWTVRMQQFFDHYLKDAPPPVWMVEGVPAIKKGKTLGLELVPEAAGRITAEEEATNGRP